MKNDLNIYNPLPKTFKIRLGLQSQMLCNIYVKVGEPTRACAPESRDSLWIQEHKLGCIVILKLRAKKGFA